MVDGMDEEALCEANDLLDRQNFQGLVKILGVGIVRTVLLVMVLMAFLCILLSLLMFFCEVHPQIGRQYNKWGWTIDEYSIFRAPLSRKFFALLIMKLDWEIFAQTDRIHYTIYIDMILLNSILSNSLRKTPFSYKNNRLNAKVTLSHL